RLERRLAVERAQGLRFRALEAHERRLAGRPVDAHVGHLARPAREVRLEGLPAREGTAGDGVALDEADAPLVLALGARPVRRTGPRPEAPAGRDTQEPIVEAHLARRCVV